MALHITSYEYSSRESSSGSWSDWESTDSTSTSVYISDLTNGTLYEFVIRAKTDDGYSPSTAAVTATPSTIPNTPYGLTATGYNGYVYLSWYMPDDGGASISDYEISYGQSGFTFGSWLSSGDTGTYEYVYSLTNGTSYKFKVRAVNLNGVSSESDTVYATPGGTPSAPTSFTATAGDGEVTLSWYDPSYTNGSTVTGFEYGYREGSGGYFSSYVSVGKTYSTTVTGLTNGTYYEFRVRATSSAGAGDRAGPIGATPEASGSVPDAPTGIDVIDLYGGTVLLYWSRPSSEVEANITDYEYAYRQSGGTWSSWSSSNSYPYAYAIISGLTVGVTYEFKALAVNSFGYSAESSTTSLTTQASTPDAPTDISGTYEGSGDVYLSWSAPYDDGGAAITGYEFRYSRTGYGLSDWISTGAWGTRTEVRLQGIVSGTEYSFEVRAVNSAGGGSASNTATVSTD